MPDKWAQYIQQPDKWAQYATAELPEGVAVVGRNTAGAAIYGPAGSPAPSGGAARRFLSSAVNAIKQPIAGAYHAFVDAPQTPEEMGTEAGGGRLALVTKRMLVDPHLAEARKAAAEAKQGNWLSRNPTAEELRHRQLAAGHGLAAVTPLVGPATAQIAEQFATQAARGDIAGAAGTLAGNAAMYALPEGAGRIARSETLTRALPRGMIARLIRPMRQDLAFGKRPAEAILSAGIVGSNLEEIGNQVVAKLGETGREIDALAQSPANAGKTVIVSGALKPLDDAMAEARKAGDQKLYRRLQNARDGIYFDWAEYTSPSGKTKLRAVGPRSMRLSPFDALVLKRMIGRQIRWTDNALDGEVNGALAGAYGQVKDALNSAMPEDFQKLNEQYSNLVGAAKAVERRLPIEQRNALVSLTDAVLGTHSLPLAAAKKIAETPAFRTRTARGLYRLRDRVPERPGVKAAPAVGVAQSSQQRLRQLQAEAERHRP